ncbi:MAG: fibronectin type III domain-containing protein [Acidobacteriota bacterium]
MRKQTLKIVGVILVALLGFLLLLGAGGKKKEKSGQYDDLKKEMKKEMKQESRLERFRKDLGPVPEKMYSGKIVIDKDAGKTIFNFSGPSWVKIKSPEGAVIYDITADPYVPDRVFASTSDSLYRSTDDGRTWQMIGGLQGWNGQAVLGFVNGSPNTLYFGASEGLWKSTDGGNTWLRIASGQITDSVSSIAVSPSDPNKILIGVMPKDWLPSPNSGLYISTNGGATFTHIDSVKIWINNDSIAFAPSDPNVIWVGGWDNSIYGSSPPTSPTPSLYKSVDGGLHWTQIPPTLIPNCLDVYPVRVNPEDSDDIFFGGYDGPYRFKHSSLQRLTPPYYQDSVSCFDVDRNNFQNVVAAVGYGYYYYYRDYNTKNWFWEYSYPARGAFFSRTAGYSWDALSSSKDGLCLAGNPNVKACVREIAITGNGTILASAPETGEGVLRWNKVQRKWEPSSSGMTQRVLGIKVNDSNPQEAWASVYTAGLYHTTDGGANWELYQPWDPANRDTLPVRHRYGNSSEIAFYRGISGQALTGAILVSPLAVATQYGTAVSSTGSPPFTTLVNPDYYDPSNFASYSGMGVRNISYGSGTCLIPPNEVLESRQIGLYENCGGVYNLLSQPGVYVNSSWEDPANMNHLVIAATNGVWETYDRGSNWSLKTASISEPIARSLAVDPANSLHWFAGMWDSASMSGDLYETTDGGANWSAKNLWVDIVSIKYNPLTAGDIWATSGTNSGPAVYHSVDNGAVWSVDWSYGPDQCGLAVFDVSIGSSASSSPWAGTSAGGVFRKEQNPPSTPTGLVVTDPATGNSLNVSWNANPEPNIEKYVVHYGVANQPLTNALETSSTSLTIPNLIQYQTYDVAVTAVNTSGEISARCPVASKMVTCGNAPPPLPTPQIPANGSTDVGANPTLSWSPSSGAVNYRVQVAEDEKFAKLVLDVQDIPETHYTIGDTTTGTVNNPYWVPYLQCAHGYNPYNPYNPSSPNPYNPNFFVYGNYWWRVIPSDSCGYRQDSSDASHFVTYPTPTAVPTLVSPPNYSSNQPLNVQLIWQPVPDATQYRVRGFVYSLQWWFQFSFDEIVNSADPYNLNVPPCCYVFWQVYAGYDCGFSDIPSEMWYFTTSGGPNSPPNLLFPPNNSYDQPLNINFQWDAVANTSYYHFELSTDPSFSYIINDSYPSSNYIFVPNLSPKTTYFWRVTPISNSCPQGPTSSVFTFVTTSSGEVCGSTPPSALVTIAGRSNGIPAYRLDCFFNESYAVARGPNGDIYVSDRNESAIYRVDHLTGIVSVYAGIPGEWGDDGEGGPATQAHISQIYGMQWDGMGNLYIADIYNNKVKKIDASTGIITTVAGNGVYGYNGDNIPATSAYLAYPSDIAVDNSQNILIADQGNHRIRKVNISTGIITTVAGTGDAGYNGDGIPATSANLYYPCAVAVDGADNIYIDDQSNNRIRRVDSATGIITTYAGTGECCYNGDDILAATAFLGYPYDIALDSNGDLLIADWARIRKVNHSTNIISTVAGNGSWGDSGDGGPAVNASIKDFGLATDFSGGYYFTTSKRVRFVNGSGTIEGFAGRISSPDGDLGRLTKLNYPGGIAYDPSGNLYICDKGNNVIRMVDAVSGVSTIIAGTGDGGYNGDNIPATSALLSYPYGVAVDNSYNVYIADTYNGRIRKIDSSTGLISTVAGTGNWGYNGDNIPATSADLSYPIDVAVDSNGNIFIADYNNQRIRKVDASTGLITTIAGTGNGGYNGDNILATSAYLNYPYGVSIDSDGNVFIADTDNSRIRKVDNSGIITTIAGLGGCGWGEDNIPAVNSYLCYPMDVIVDSSNNIYIAEWGYRRARRIDGGTGIITTVAGNGWYRYSGEGYPPTSASFEGVASLAINPSGQLAISDSENGRVRIVVPPQSIFTRAGVGYAGSNVFEGVYATESEFLFNYGADASEDIHGNIYVADFGNNRIRKIDPDGKVWTFAGNGNSSESGDGGPATSASLANPNGVCADRNGNVYVADYSGSTIRMIDTSGIIHTVAGNGSPGYSGDGGPATLAQISYPWNVSVDNLGNLYISDADNFVIRKVDKATQIITTVAGNGTQGYSGDEGIATSAQLNYPVWVAPDNKGGFFIADALDNRIRYVDAYGIIHTYAGTGTAGFSGDGGPASSAQINFPISVSVDGAGGLYIADYNNSRIRYVDFNPSHNISTIAGTGDSDYYGDCGLAADAAFNRPSSVCVTPSGYILVTEDNNSTVRQIIPQKLYGKVGPPALIYPPNLAVNIPPTLTLNWSPAYGSYHIQIATDSSFVNLVYDQTGIAANSFDASLSPGVTYYWHVMTESTCGGSDYSAPFSFTTGAVDTTPPTTPVVTDSGEYTSSSVQLWGMWSSSDPETGISYYEVGIGTTPSTPDIVDWTNVGSATAHTFSGLSLSSGTVYYILCRATNGQNLTSATGASDGITVDLTPPTTPIVVDGGEFTSSSNSLTANWSSQDSESQIAKYMVAVGTSAGLSDVMNWQDYGLSTGGTISGLSLSQGVSYFISVKSVNGAGLVSAIGSSDGITVDRTPPTQPIVVDDGDTTQSLTTLHAIFQSSEDVTTITGYRYCIGTYQGGQDVKGWTDSPTNEVTATGLSLTSGQTYYFTARAKNSLNMWSTNGFSDGITVLSSLPSPVPDGTFGSKAMTVTKLAGDGSQIRVDFDASTCPAPNYSIYYGNLNQVSSYSFSGSVCGVDTDGNYDWTTVPSGNIFFIVVSNNGSGTEGSWGKDRIGGTYHERGGETPSNLCGNNIHNNGGTCP